MTIVIGTLGGNDSAVREYGPHRESFTRPGRNGNILVLGGRVSIVDAWEIEKFLPAVMG